MRHSFHIPLLWNFRSFSVWTILIVCMTNCKHKNEDGGWNEAYIDPTISKNGVYALLDHQKEILLYGGLEDSLMKRTSDVAYASGKNIDLNSYYSKYNNCRADFSR